VLKHKKLTFEIGLFDCFIVVLAQVAEI